MKLLCIGYGSIAHRHLQNFIALQPVSQTTILNRSTKPDALSSQLNAQFVPSLTPKILADTDYAIIASPSALHFDVLQQLLLRHVPCYIEKPIVSSIEQKTVLASIIAAQKLPPTLVGFQLRFLPSLQKIKSILSAGKLGQVVRASFEAGQWLPDWRSSQDYRQSYSAKKSLGGGVILDLTHEVDIANWLFGDFDQVFARANNLSSLEIETEAVCCAILSKSAGPIVTLQMDYVSRAPVRRYTIVGDEASLIWDLHQKQLLLLTKKSKTPIALKNNAFDMSESYVSAMKKFIHSVTHSQTHEHTLPACMSSMELALRIKETALT